MLPLGKLIREHEKSYLEEFNRWLTARIQTIIKLHLKTIASIDFSPQGALGVLRHCLGHLWMACPATAIRTQQFSNYDAYRRKCPLSGIHPLKHAEHEEQQRKGHKTSEEERVRIEWVALLARYLMQRVCHQQSSVNLFTRACML